VRSLTGVIASIAAHSLDLVEIDNEVLVVDFLLRLGHMHDLANDPARRRLAVGAAVLENLRRPAIQPVSQISEIKEGPATAPEVTEAATTAPRRIAGTPRHG
jgi:hypothetical protein